jgi:ABC-2 type transport system ATP-binding protein
LETLRRYAWRVLSDSPPHSLSVHGLAKRYAGGAGVSDVSLSVPRGSITGFIGVNGAGKSTTLKCVLGLLRPDAGEIRLFGAPATAKGRQRIGFLPEERGMAAHERIVDVIAFHARLKGMSGRAARARAEFLLERIGLSDRRRARVGELSKGNAQRIQILSALAHQPELLVLDEPLTGLDPIGQAEILSLFREYAAGGGAILFSTHSMPAAQSVCDHVVMISGGRTVFEGSLDEAAGKAPHGAVVVTADRAGLTRAAEAVGGRVEAMGRSIGEAARWRVVLPRETPHPALIRALADHRVPFLSFEPTRADLEGAFWQLAADPAAAAAPVRAAA